MDELPNQAGTPPTAPTAAPNPTSTKKKFSLNNLPLLQKVALFGGLFIFLLIILVSVLVLANGNANKKAVPQTNPEEEINEAKKEQAEKAQKEASASTPANQIQSAYSDVIGSDNVKKTLQIDSLGVVTIEYTIASSDGQTVIKTSYENFADLASKIFNIPSATELNVTTYATKFTDKFGQPDQPALKMQITRTTNAKVNWPLKKFSYVNYATILDFHELNPLLQKDYETLTKTKKST